MTIKEKYQKSVIPKLQEKFGYRNILQVPRVTKIVLNVGISSDSKDPKFLESVKETLRTISGQHPVPRGAKQSISNFKTRKGQIVGLTVTLRGSRMYHFLEKLIHLALPRVRDFRGLDAHTIDKSGNMTIGLRESIAFPEVKVGELDRQHGLEITIVNNAKTKEQGKELLALMGLPFKESRK